MFGRPGVWEVPPAASVEQIAKRAGVTRATVYRRFPDKTRLLIAAVESAYGTPQPVPEIPDLDFLIGAWAAMIAEPRHRRLMRRLLGVAEDEPEPARVYHESLGRGRDDARLAVFEQARERGELPADCDVRVLLDILTGAAWQHLAAHPDTDTPADVKHYLRAVLHQA
ncbi:TetR/AcrR family transcriptional regulator [Phytomonospora endophytica]|uniref:AcrR family transcriptional regulator n=1 Tax=Phytomonospora endophytica TaxID=714109 RepID=A0A841FVC1_9ACTN|nr:TetR/AcrR family transcriptional regulator [Phytomonospora endophytica]MBB6037287.1 AcrR family transcriptional regulator [Phytomonospora endophytica]GIG69969.1 TetR family transcriptional regulator [Phytomonospora endophytica]